MVLAFHLGGTVEEKRFEMRAAHGIRHLQYDAKLRLNRHK